MALPPIKADQDAFSAWYLQPGGCDPGDAMGYFGVGTPGERNALERKGFTLLSDVQGAMNDPDNPLLIRPVTMERCEWLLQELRSRVPAERERLEELLIGAVEAQSDGSLPMSERQIYRERTIGLREKLMETYRILPITASQRRGLLARITELGDIASNKDLLDDERKEARDEARHLKRLEESTRTLRPYTPSGLRSYFLLGFRVQLENRVPKPHWEVQAKLQEIAALQSEERIATVAAEQEVAEIMGPLAEETEETPQPAVTGGRRRQKED